MRSLTPLLGRQTRQRVTWESKTQRFDYSIARKSCHCHVLELIWAGNTDLASGHFDILYKVEDTMNVAAISIPEHLVNPQIHRASGSGYIPCSGNPQYFERYDPDVLHLPGISYIPTAPPKTIAPEYYPSCSQTQGPVPCSLGSVTSSPYIPSALLFHSSFPDCASEDSFRPSKFQLDIDRLKYYSPQWEEIMEPCQTEAMKQ